MVRSGRNALLTVALRHRRIACTTLFAHPARKEAYQALVIVKLVKRPSQPAADTLRQFENLVAKLQQVDFSSIVSEVSDEPFLEN